MQNRIIFGIEVSFMKRILPLILTVLLLPALLAVPARADDIDQYGWIDLVDFGTADDSGGNYVRVTTSGQIIRYQVPADQGMLLGTVDIIFRCNQRETFTGLVVSNGSRDFSGTVTSFGNGYYRFTCDTGGYRFTEFQIKPTISIEDAHYFEFLSVRVSPGYFDPMVMSADLTGLAYNGTDFSASYRGESVAATWDMAGTGYDVRAFSSYIRMVGNVQAYDYIDLLLVVTTGYIDSIVVDDGITSLPYEVNTFVDLGQEIASQPNTLISLRIDVRNIESGHVPTVRITGESSTAINRFVISSCTGLVSIDPPSPLVFWFNQLFDNISAQTNSIVGAFEAQFDELIPLLTDWTKPIPKALNSINNHLIAIQNSVVDGFNNLPTWISEQTTAISNAISTWGQNIVDAILGNFDPSGIQSGIDSAVGELNQAGAALDAVQRPDIGQIDINVVGMLDPSGLAGLSSIVALFTGNTLIYRIIFMFLTLALISYVLYGKR